MAKVQLDRDGQASSKKSWFARHKFLTAVGAVVVVGGIAAATSGDDATTAASESSPASAQSDESSSDSPVAQNASDATEEAEAPEAVEDPEAAESATIGDAVRDGKFEFTVTEIELGIESIGEAPFDQQAQGQFALVYVSVSNIGNEAQLFDGSSQILIDDQGREHSSDSGATVYLEDSESFLNQINPGNAVDGIIAFDIPVDAVPVELRLHDSMFSGGVTVALN